MDGVKTLEVVAEITVDIHQAQDSKAQDSGGMFRIPNMAAYAELGQLQSSRLLPLLGMDG
jgi:hypothetical protein